MNEIKPVNSPKEINTFVQFPFCVFRKNPNWIPPITTKETKSLKKMISNTLPCVEFKAYLVYQNKKPVGRIAFIINNDDCNKIRFGWIDMIDDINVTALMIKTGIDLAKKRDIKTMEGPLGLSNMDKAGMLVEGFEHLGNITTIYNPEYYPIHLKKLGFKQNKIWLEYKLGLEFLTPTLEKKAQSLIDEFGLKIKRPKNKKEFEPLLNQMFELINKTHKTLSSFTPLTKAQIEFYKKKYRYLLRDEYSAFIVNKKDKLVAFGISGPSFSEILKKGKGKLSLVTIIRLKRAFKKNNTANLFLIAIDEQYQKKGLHRVIFNKIGQTLKKIGIHTCEVGPILENNESMIRIWKYYNASVFKKRSTFYENIEDIKI